MVFKRSVIFHSNTKPYFRLFKWKILYFKSWMLSLKLFRFALSFFRNIQKGIFLKNLSDIERFPSEIFLQNETILGKLMLK